MALIQIWLGGQSGDVVLTHGGLCVRSWCGKGERHKREKWGEKCRLWYWIKPSHFLYTEPELLSTLHIWWWYLHEGKAGAYGSGLVLEFLCMNFWEKVCSCSLVWADCLWFSDGKLIKTNTLWCFISNCCDRLSIFRSLAPCFSHVRSSLCLCVAELWRKSVALWWWCCYGLHRHQMSPVCVCLHYRPTVTHISFSLSWTGIIPCGKTWYYTCIKAVYKLRRITGLKWKDNKQTWLLESV